MFILKACKEEEEELEGTEDPEAFKEFRRLCAQESPHDDDDENDDAMILVVRGILVVPSARFCVPKCDRPILFYPLRRKKGREKKNMFRVLNPNRVESPAFIKRSRETRSHRRETQREAHTEYVTGTRRCTLRGR